MKKTTKLWTLAIALLALFLAFTAVVMNVDVQPIGPEGSSVGLAGLNGPIKDFIGGYHDTYFKIADYLGYIGLLSVGFFAMVGLLQLIRGGIKGVDYRIWILGGFYVAVGACYLLFTKVAINYRPVILPLEGLEPSYPSSHTMLSFTCTGAVIFQAKYMLKKRPALRKAVNAVALVLMIALIGARFASGAHWMTDILGSVILSASLMVFYAAAVKTVEKKIRKSKKARRARR